MHKNAKRGSGGVGFFVRKELNNYYDIEIIDKTTEGILWICVKTKDKQNAVCFYACVCYLPPQESSRMVDPANFLDTLLGQIHMYGLNAPFYVCGDFNSRTSNLDDFIAGIDDIPERHVVDFTQNKYGQHFCEFLIDANCCILNGRQNSIKNSYTFVSPSQGSSVVDYCVVPYEQLCNFDSFNVQSMCELLEEFHLVNRICSASSGSDHSLISWKFDFKKEFNQLHKRDQQATIKSVKECYKRAVPSDFLSSKAELLENVINKLNHNVDCQATIDTIYSDLELVIKSEMMEKLDFKVTTIKWGVNNKRRRVKKPWWSDNLTVLWNNVCEAEKVYLSCSHGVKPRNKKQFLDARKHFDREVQKSKRQFHQKQQADIEALNADNPREFWKEIGKIGIGTERQKQLPFEVINTDKETLNEPKQKLNEWRKSFSNQELMTRASSSHYILRFLHGSAAEQICYLIG